MDVMSVTEVTGGAEVEWNESGMRVESQSQEALPSIRFDQ